MSPILPDPGELDAIAERIASFAGATHTRATVLAGSLAGLDWHGLAAGAFDGLAQNVVGGLRTAADRLDDAAAALHRHADTVRERIVALERIADDAVHLARDLGTGLADVVLHPTHLLDDGADVVADTGGLVSDAGHLLGI